jgi:HEPN domain-containing protein
MDWLRYARSDLALAKVHRPAEVLWVTLCYHAQQCIEKCLKSVLLQHQVSFPYTHDLSSLITLVKEAKIIWHDDLNLAAALTMYAIESRYPGNLEPITEDQYLNAITLSEKVLCWAEAIVNKQ